MKKQFFLSLILISSFSLHANDDLQNATNEFQKRNASMFLCASNMMTICTSMLIHQHAKRNVSLDQKLQKEWQEMRAQMKQTVKNVNDLATRHFLQAHAQKMSEDALTLLKASITIELLADQINN